MYTNHTYYLSCTNNLYIYIPNLYIGSSNSLGSHGSSSSPGIRVSPSFPKFPSFHSFPGSAIFLVLKVTLFHLSF